MTDGDTERWMRKDGERKASNINQVHTGRRKRGMEAARERNERGVEPKIGGWMDGVRNEKRSVFPSSLISLLLSPPQRELMIRADEIKSTGVTRRLLIRFGSAWM